jgi:TonB family protein
MRGAAAGWTLGQVMPLVMLLTPSLAAAQQSGSGAVPGGATGAVIRPPEPQPDAPKPVVVMPEIVHFENAPYPPEAEKAGLQGSVVLKLTIDKDGNVSAAEVMEPAGNGFDEAAQAAALKFKFKPATRDGVPFAAKIKYSYDFTLKVVEAPPPPPPTTGELAGKLLIAGADAPLAGAELVFVGPDGAEQRATTDGTGSFKLPVLAPGKYKIKVNASGFDPLEVDEEVVAGEALDVKYRLSPVSEGLEITVKGERPPREVTRRTLERREINRIPGTGGDALRSLQSLPGVARPPGLAGLLIVRGSAPDGTAYFVDGTEVPLIYHFGGLSSVVPTELLDQIDFYPGNFSARYGRVMGGIVDVQLRKPDTKCNADYGKPTDKTGCFHGMAQVDLIDARILVQGPITKNWSFAAAGRYSWFDKWLKPVLEQAGSSVTSAPVYSDYQLIAEHNTAKSRTSIRAFGSDDRFEVIITDPAAQDPAFGGNLRFGTSFVRAQVLNESKLSSKVDLNSMFSVGRQQINFGLGIFKFDLDLHPIYWREELSVKAAKGVKINAGMDFSMSPFKVLVRAPQPPREGEPDPGPFATRPLSESQDKGFSFRPAWYVEGELTPLDRLRVVPGVRLDFARDSGHADFSPRINARYDVVKGAGTDPGAGAAFQRRTTLKGGAGVYAQPPQFQETDEVFGTPNIKSNRSLHYAFGVEQEITRYIDLSVEAFYKDLTNQVARSVNELSGRYLYNNLGTGSVKGIETLLKFKPTERFFGWVAYTVSRSVRRDGPGLEEYLFQYDQTHNLIMLGSYRLGRGWEFGARFRIVSGSLDTPVVGRPSLPSVYSADAAAYAPLQGRPYTARMPLFHQLDIRVDKRWQFRSWALSAYLDVQNVYNHAAAESFIYNYDYSRRSYQTGIPIIPSLGIRGEL